MLAILPFMAGLGKITRWSVTQLSSYEQMQFHRERRAQARESIAKMSAQASNFGNIQVNKSVAMGDITSRIAMNRIKLSKQA